MSILKDFDFKNPTATQIKGIIPILDGKNVLLTAPTGSGKTEAALLPMISNLLKKSKKWYFNSLYHSNKSTQQRYVEEIDVLGFKTKNNS